VAVRLQPYGTSV